MKLTPSIALAGALMAASAWAQNPASPPGPGNAPPAATAPVPPPPGTSNPATSGSGLANPAAPMPQPGAQQPAGPSAYTARPSPHRPTPRQARRYRSRANTNTMANQLNAQELARLRGGSMPAAASYPAVPRQPAPVMPTGVGLPPPPPPQSYYPPPPPPQPWYPPPPPPPGYPWRPF